MSKAGKHAPITEVSGSPNLHFVRRELESRLRSIRLTPGQPRIAQCIIERGGEIGLMSSTEVAELAKVSQPSITRFATALGYGGFLEMRRELRPGRDDQVAPEGDLDRYQSAAPPRLPTSASSSAPLPMRATFAPAGPLSPARGRCRFSACALRPGWPGSSAIAAPKSLPISG